MMQTQKPSAGAIVDTCGRLRYLYIDTAVFTPPVNSNRQGVILFTLYTILKFISAKVTFFFDIAKQFDIFFFIFLIFYAKKHILARFLSSEYGKMQKKVLKSQALERDANAGIREASPFLYLQCSLPSALNSPVSSPTFSGFSSR